HRPRTSSMPYDLDSLLHRNAPWGWHTCIGWAHSAIHCSGLGSRLALRARYFRSPYLVLSTQDTGPITATATERSLCAMNGHLSGPMIAEWNAAAADELSRGHWRWLSDWSRGLAPVLWGRLSDRASQRFRADTKTARVSGTAQRRR